MEYKYDLIVERPEFTASFTFDTYHEAYSWGREQFIRHTNYTKMTIICFDEYDENNYTIMKSGNRNDWIEQEK